MAFGGDYPYNVRLGQTYLYTTAAVAVTPPTASGDVKHGVNTRTNDDTPSGSVIEVNIALSVPAMQLHIQILWHDKDYLYAQLTFRGNIYQVVPSSFEIPELAPYSASLILDVAEGDVLGAMQVRLVSTTGFDGYTGTIETVWLAVPALPFAVPLPMGFVSDALATGLTLPDGWVTFEKSFGFASPPDTINLLGVTEDDEEYAGITIPKNSGIYIPDYLTLNRHAATLRAFAGDLSAPELVLSYADYVLEAVTNTQLGSSDVMQVQPTITADLGDRAIVSDVSYRKVRIKSKVPPKASAFIDNAGAAGACAVLMNDGTVRLLVSKFADGGFDLYEVSNTGATLMFSDLWDDTYHGAQIAWLIDGTLISYAWKITYFAGDDDTDAGARYGLYFKRSLDDGTHWEIQQTVVENLTSVTGLPILTQNIVTGKLTIGNKFSNDMGLNWN